MAIRSNKYNDPALGEVFSNIASMFAPPDAGDTVNYAQAREINQRADIIEKLKSDPRYAGADAGVLANLFDPTSSFYAQDQNNATAIRGQDVSAATSRANNLQTNQFDLLGKRVDPIAQDAMLPAVSPEIAAAMGLDSALPQIDGLRSPLSETQVRGGMLANTPLTEQQMIALAMGTTPVENIVTPEGPRTVLRTEAVGAEPYFNKGAEAKPELYSYTTPTGERGTAILEDGGLVDSQTKQPLPRGTQAAKANITGTAEEIGMGPTVSNVSEINRRKAEVTRTLNTLDLYQGLLTNNPGAIGLPGLIRGTAQNAVEVTKDLANSFGSSAPEVQEFAADIQNGLKNVAPELFDTSIAEAEFYQGTLAYALARTENPSGEVSRQAYEAAKDRINGGFLQNTASSQAAVAAFRKVLETELSAIDTMADPATARTDTAYPGDADVARPVSEADYNALPSGALFVDPDDGQTYRKP